MRAGVRETPYACVGGLIPLMDTVLMAFYQLILVRKERSYV